MKNNLTRKELFKYLSSNNETEKRLIEKKSMADALNEDAFEGWNNPLLSKSNLRALDKKYLPNKIWPYILGAVILIGVSTGLLWTQFSSEKNIPTEKLSLLEVNKVEYIDQTDVILPDAITEMTELPSAKQIKPRNVAKDFTSNQHSEENPKVEIDPKELNLPVNILPEVKKPVQIVREQTLGKEVYLKEMKLLDYRSYRSRPTIKTEQIILTGTPANVGEVKNEQSDGETRTIDVPYIEYLEKSVSYFAKGQYKKSLARFQVILNTYPDDINAHFYSGLCYYNLNDFSNAIASFNSCLQSKYSNFNEEAQWYMAKSLLASGNKKEGIELLEIIVKQNGFYSGEAKQLKSKI